SESLLTPLTRSYIESRARFCDCVVSAHQERDLAMEQILYLQRSKFPKDKDCKRSLWLSTSS
ncbi:hypothetical protein, partial [uncultured Helicobacter sp.]